MNTELLRAVERQLLEVSGILTIADSPEDIRFGHQRLIGIIHGLKIVIDGIEQAEPVTLGELEERQFNRAKEASQEKKHVQRS